MKKILSVLGLSVLSISAQASTLGDINSLDQNFNAIIGGVEVQPGQPVATSTVMIVGKEAAGESKGSTFICSGSLIDKDLVLTAAHCLGSDGRAPVVVVFRTSVSGKGPIGQVSAAIRDADFLKGVTDDNNAANWNDLAMLRLAEPAPAGYAPVKMLTSADALTDGANITLAGYGITMPTPSTDPKVDDGAGTLRSVSQTIKKADYSTTEVTVNETNSKGACHGDSGGPAMIQKNGQLYLFGVASRLDESDRVANNNDVSDFACSVEMIYTSVVAQSDWIKKASDRLHSVDLSQGNKSNF